MLNLPTNIDNPLGLSFFSDQSHSCQIWSHYSYDLVEVLNRLYKHKGPQYSFDSVLPLTTYPSELVSHRAHLISKKKAIDETEILNVLKKRIEDFIEHLSKYDHFYLFRDDQVIGYATGNYTPFHTMGEVAPGMRKNHLEHLASLIEKYPNLKVRITKQKSEIYFIVNPIGVAFGVGPKESAVWAIALTGHATTDAFIKKYMELWEKAEIRIGIADYFRKISSKITDS